MLLYSIYILIEGQSSLCVTPKRFVQASKGRLVFKVFKVKPVYRTIGCSKHAMTF